MKVDAMYECMKVKVKNKVKVKMKDQIQRSGQCLARSLENESEQGLAR